MSHAITIGGPILSVGVLAGVLMLLFGALSLFGNMMADTAGDGGKSGCTISIIGVVLAIGCLTGLFA